MADNATDQQMEHVWDDSTIYAEDTECIACGAIMSETDSDECS